MFWMEKQHAKRGGKLIKNSGYTRNYETGPIRPLWNKAGFINQIIRDVSSTHLIDPDKQEQRGTTKQKTRSYFCKGGSFQTLVAEFLGSLPS